VAEEMLPALLSLAGGNRAFFMGCTFARWHTCQSELFQKKFQHVSKIMPQSKTRYFVVVNIFF
jgi:hypothetical protein